MSKQNVPRIYWIEDMVSGPVKLRSGGQDVLCFFTTEDGAYEFMRHAFGPSRMLPRPSGDPATQDDCRLASSDHAEELRTLCRQWTGLMTGDIDGFYIDPSTEPYSDELPIDLDDMLERISEVEQGGRWTRGTDEY